MSSPLFKDVEAQVSDQELAAFLQTACRHMEQEIHRRIIGQQEAIEHLLVLLFAKGHGLFVGVPGLAKTLLIQSLAQTLDLTFHRIQFTPDLMPSDITGSDILDLDEQGRRSMRFLQGPLFCNMLLADEINRTPPKTQSALLQAMQEGQVTAGGKTYHLTPPFIVLATQNPIEQEGTYPLPEAQLDRFMMMLQMDYPSQEEEIAIVSKTTAPLTDPIRPILSPAMLTRLQALILRVPVADELIHEAVTLVRQTRPKQPHALPAIRQYVAFGAGPRAGQHLIWAAKARALLQGRLAVDRQDIHHLALPVLRHRVLLNFQADLANVTVEQLLIDILQAQKPS